MTAELCSAGRPGAAVPTCVMASSAATRRVQRSFVGGTLGVQGRSCICNPVVPAGPESCLALTQGSRPGLSYVAPPGLDSLASVATRPLQGDRSFYSCK